MFYSCHRGASPGKAACTFCEPSVVTVLIYIWARRTRLFAQTTFVLEGENQWRPFLNKRLATQPN